MCDASRNSSKQCHCPLDFFLLGKFNFIKTFLEKNEGTIISAWRLLARGLLTFYRNLNKSNRMRLEETSADQDRKFYQSLPVALTQFLCSSAIRYAVECYFAGSIPSRGCRISTEAKCKRSCTFVFRCVRKNPRLSEIILMVPRRSSL